jgi:hypothetical protein
MLDGQFDWGTRHKFRDGAIRGALAAAILVFVVLPLMVGYSLIFGKIF